MAKRNETFSRVQVIRKGPDTPVNKQPGFRREDVAPEIPTLQPETQEQRETPEALQETPPPRVIDRTNPAQENLAPMVGDAVRVLEEREKEAEKTESKPVAKEDVHPPVAKSSIESPATKQPAQGRALKETRPVGKKAPAKKAVKKTKR